MPAVLLLMVALNDPRIAIVQLQGDGLLDTALAATSRALEADPDTAARLGLHYLQGDLLDRLGRRAEATESFALALSATPKLSGHARLRIAIDQDLLGHPEVAAGLTATLLASNPPSSVVGPAIDLLARALEQGGDCRLLGGLRPASFRNGVRRLIELAGADCDLRVGRNDTARQTLVALLEESTSDVAALAAARRLGAFPDTYSQVATLELVGSAFLEHRIFDRSADLLGRVVLQLDSRIRSTRDFDTRFQWVRSSFWIGHFELAAERYADLASRTATPHQIAQALYHRARSLELAGHFSAAADGYRRAFVAQREGSFASASLLGALRLDWLAGREEPALELYEVLKVQRLAGAERTRAALFLAASDLAQKRLDRAERWLSEAAAWSNDSAGEVHYWRGRLAETAGDPSAAIDAYLRTIRRDYFDPMSQLAMVRLATPGLAAAAQARADASGNDSSRWFDSWILLGVQPSDPRREELRARLEQRFVRDHPDQHVVSSLPVPVDSWPIWSATLTEPEDQLLALGIWSEGAGAALRHFPVARPDLALTASRHLEAAGRTRDSLLIAEILQKRVPKRIPEPLLADDLRRALYPFSYRPLIERSAERHRIEPLLLAALIREESKFDPRAASAAAARGLTQFVLTTAERVARNNGMGVITPRDLERPEVSIELGAAYLRELLDRFGESWPQAIAAYNAGEDQALLWERYCLSKDPAEFLTKVGFQETRAYLSRVFSAFGQYHSLYRPTSYEITERP